MSNIRAIRTEADYEAALARIDALMDAKLGTPEGEELDVLTDLVELYEAKHVPMGYPTALDALRFRMEQADLSPRDLIPFIGSRAKVSEVLAGKRPLTMQMARALHANLGIPADVLLQQPGGEMPNALNGIDWRRFPVAEMAKQHGLSIDELFGKGRKGKGSVAPKYRDPKNPQNTWSGRGRMPRWLTAATKGGKSKKEDYLI